jgi:multiple sugar transport system substrate-binding protein
MFNRKNRSVVTFSISLVLVLAFVVGAPNLLMAKKIKLTVWHDSSHPLANKIYEKKAEEFLKENPNVEWEAFIYPDDIIRQKLYPALAGGVAPNILQALPEQEIFMRSGICVPMSEDLQEWIKEHDYHADEFYDIDGKYYSAAYAMDSPMPFYNLEIWQEAGMSDKDLPETWSELREIAKKLTKYDGSGNVSQAGFAFNGRTNGMVYDYLLQLGGHMWSKDGRTCVMNSPEGVEAWQFLYDLMWVDKVNSPGFLNYNEAFGTGKAAMTWCYSWFRDSLESNYPDIKFEQFPNPLPDDRPFGSPEFWAYGRCDTQRTYLVLHSSKEREEASWKYLESVYKDNEVLRSLAETVKCIPLRKELIALPYYQTGWYEIRSKIGLNTIFAPMENHLYIELLTDAEHAILREKKPIEEVLEEVVESENEYLETQPFFVGRDRY